jgi:hypothetical protein
MGLKPSPQHSLNRKDNDGPYTPDNCEWVTQKAQMNNFRGNRIIEFNGERWTMSQWAALVGIRYGTLQARLASGWPTERALTEPVNH